MDEQSYKALLSYVLRVLHRTKDVYYLEVDQGENECRVIIFEGSPTTKHVTTVDLYDTISVAEFIKIYGFTEKEVCNGA